ncbi:MAG: sensor domain-containing diguanylate cyclase [Pseudolabrys sp.]|nr:sensor domain-containing diguanylate cyclase [Pseudolabrys sp.]
MSPSKPTPASQSLPATASPPLAPSAADVAEDKRLAKLAELDLLDSPSEASIDRISRIAQAALGVPLAGVSLIDGHRQWHKSRQGPLAKEGPKSDSFCNVAIKLGEPLVVEDATIDERFKDNPLVTGGPQIRAYAGAQLRTRDGYELGALCVIDTKPRQFAAPQIALLKDLADMVASELEAQRQATTDSLTGAPSRRGFRGEAERAVALASRHRHPLSCVSFDLDHFKQINDSYGHAMGDHVLIETVKTCRERIRDTDILGRIGGEEFAIVLPHTDLLGAKRLAEEIRSGLSSRMMTTQDVGLKVTASFGIATLEPDVTTLDELLRRADAALYAAKQGGRNGCSVFQPERTPAPITNMRRVLKAGQIVFNAGRSVVDCTIRAIGTKAASIDVSTSMGIPDRFKLNIPGDGVSQLCEIKQKREKRIEVVFA